MAVITVSREMGTGAYNIASEIAKKLKYTLVDGQRISLMASQYGLTPELLQLVDEKPPAYITAEDRKRAAALNAVELIILRPWWPGSSEWLQERAASQVHCRF